MIHVLATIVAQAGQRDALAAAFAKLRPAVLAEQGCIQYDTTIDMASGLAAQAPIRPDVIMVIEKWETVPHLDAHLQAPHMHAFRAANGHLIAGVTINVLQPAG